MGWSLKKAATRQYEYAQELTDLGVAWRPMQRSDRPAIERMVRAHVEGAQKWSMETGAGAVVAIDANEDIIGAAVVMMVDFDGNVAALIQHLVVLPEWRGRGVGEVTLGVVQQLPGRVLAPGRAVSLFWGHCHPSAARFYQRAGYTVLQEGERFPVPFAPDVEIALSNPSYPCWFYRQGPAMPLQQR